MRHKLPPGEASARHLYYVYRRSAKKRSLEFNLSFNDAIEIWKQPCSYCGAEPQIVYQHNPNSNGGIIYNGIDRINNDLGYTKDNCTSCCKICNFAKRNQDLEDFKTWVKQAYIHMFEQELVQAW